MKLTIISQPPKKTQLQHPGVVPRGRVHPFKNKIKLRNLSEKTNKMMEREVHEIVYTNYTY